LTECGELRLGGVLSVATVGPTLASVHQACDCCGGLYGRWLPRYEVRYVSW
jgi:hypothetical protein